MIEIHVPVVVFGDHTKNVKYIDFNFVPGADGTKIIKPLKIDSRFFYYLIKYVSFNIRNRGYERHFSLLNSAVLFIPPFNEQIRIVIKLQELEKKIELIEHSMNSIENDKILLKSKIIDSAIKGQLTNQLPTDEPSSKLIEKIMDEKHRLMKEGKIKKENLSIIYKGTDNQFYEKFDDGKIVNVTNEIPFQLPQNWNWTKLKTIAFVTKLAGFEYTKNIQPNLSKNGIPLFKGKNVQNGNIVLNFESYIPEKISKELPRSQLNGKCLLTPYVGTIGNIAIFDGSFKAHLGSNVGKIELYGNILEEYILYYLRSRVGNNQLKKYKKSTAQESISIEAIRECYIALPPLEEQERIVSQIDQLLIIIQ